MLRRCSACGKRAHHGVAPTPAGRRCRSSRWRGASNNRPVTPQQTDSGEQLNNRKWPLVGVCLPGAQRGRIAASAWARSAMHRERSKFLEGSTSAKCQQSHSNRPLGNRSVRASAAEGAQFSVLPVCAKSWIVLSVSKHTPLIGPCSQSNFQLGRSRASSSCSLCEINVAEYHAQASPWWADEIGFASASTEVASRRMAGRRLAVLLRIVVPITGML